MTHMEPTASEPDEEELFSDLERFVEAHGIPLDIEALLADLDAGRCRRESPGQDWNGAPGGI
ncbi:MAG: hypothetical protein F4189_11135 [Acidimicrobiaceae bacterium]|nr:hypothetical protein [Acidimicrobiaceae bacterium]